MRWAHVQRGPLYGYAPDAVTLLSTPLYSNTTLVSFFPALATGGAVLLMAKFDAQRYLTLAERHRVTHTMLVPVQYQRLMAQPDFDRYDLSSYRMKLSTSAPFAAALKAEILRRWPGALVEFYGMTEGGGACVLAARVSRGLPAPGHEIRLIESTERGPRARPRSRRPPSGMMTVTTSKVSKRRRPSGSTRPASASFAPATSAASMQTAS